MRFHTLIFFFLAPALSLAFPYSSLPRSECLRCHGNLTPSASRRDLAPELPHAFSMRWKMRELSSENRPPAVVSDAPYLPGETYYDWDRQSMTEVYPRKCIDIFPEGRDYPCQFTSRGNRTYHIRFKPDAPREVASCCRWSSSDFWGPRPDVLHNMVFDKTLALGAKDTAWWILDIPLPGPFGYGMLRGTNTPVAFWFPVLSGWVQQEFSDFSPAKPDSSHFELPPQCSETSPVCENS